MLSNICLSAVKNCGVLVFNLKGKVMMNHTIIIDTAQVGFNLQTYLDCLEEHQGKNTVIFVTNGSRACYFGPAVVYPDYTVRWFSSDGEVVRSDWIEDSKDFDRPRWDSEFEKTIAWLCLKYNDCPKNYERTPLDNFQLQHSLTILSVVGRLDRLGDFL